MIDHQAADDYGVPEKMFGAQDDDFYGAIGRIVNLSALLEIRLIAIHQALAGVEQDVQTNLPASDLCTHAEALVKHALEAGTLTQERSELIARFLDRAKHLLAKRHDYVHNVWSRTGDQIVYGWRPGRHGKLTPEKRAAEMAELDDLPAWFTESACTEKSGEARSTVTSLVELHSSWPVVFAACQTAKQQVGP